MKKRIISLFLMAALLLSACGAKQELPSDWKPDWTVVCPLLAVEPMEGFSFGERADTLGLGGVYYATWTSGEKRDYTNAEGEKTFLFDAQIYLVVQECLSEADAHQSISQWTALEKQNYSCGEPWEIDSNGRTYTLLPMNEGREGNPYGFGCAAFTRIGTNALCVELVCTDAFTGDAQAVLEDFLSGLHFSE